jgi:UDP-2,3-diacylglucosamine hydrolase
VALTAPADRFGPASRLVPAAGIAAIDFISDLHLHASRPATLRAFEQLLLQADSQALVILGDLFEVWVGDDAMAEQGIERDVGGWLSEAASRYPIWLMHGNRDFLIGRAFAQATGVTLLPDPTVLQAFGRKVLLTHGDELCVADTDYQRFRRQVRDPAWQQAVLARPLAERRVLAQNVRHASEARKHGSEMSDWADVDADAAAEWLNLAGTDVMIHGHTHRPGSGAIGSHNTRHVLTDWDLDDASAPRAEVMRLSADGFARLPWPPAG